MPAYGQGRSPARARRRRPPSGPLNDPCRPPLQPPAAATRVRAPRLGYGEPECTRACGTKIQKRLQARPRRTGCLAARMTHSHCVRAAAAQAPAAVPQGSWVQIPSGPPAIPRGRGRRRRGPRPGPATFNFRPPPAAPHAGGKVRALRPGRGRGAAEDGRVRGVPRGPHSLGCGAYVPHVRARRMLRLVCGSTRNEAL